MLPPARASLIAADQPIRVAIPQPVTTVGVFDPGCSAATAGTDRIRPQSPGARLGDQMRRLGDAAESLPTYARSVFAALAAVAWRLAEHPSPVIVPAGRSPELRRALEMTNQRLGEEVRFEDIAGVVGLAPRSLARRFEDESGMTWRAVLRRMRVLRAIEELAADDAGHQNRVRVGYSSPVSLQRRVPGPDRPHAHRVPRQLPPVTGWLHPGLDPIAGSFHDSGKTGVLQDTVEASRRDASSAGAAHLIRGAALSRFACSRTPCRGVASEGDGPSSK